MPRTPRRMLATLAVLALAPAATAQAQAQAQGSGVSLFRVIGPRDEVTIGLTEAALARLGTGPAVERIARALVANGQLTAWHYAVSRAPDGGTRYAARGQVAILRSDSLRIEPLVPALPVAPPPAE